MCMEDVLVLSTLLKEVKHVGDIEKAFHAYDEVRRPRTQRNVVTSKEAGTLYEFELEGDDLERIKALSDVVVCREQVKLDQAEMELGFVDTCYFPVYKHLLPMVDKALA